MNNIVKGISQIKDSILYSFILSIVVMGLQFLSSFLNNLIFMVFILFILLGALVLFIFFLVKLIQGMRMLRAVNLNAKLNQRLDEAIRYFFLALGIGIFVIVLMIIGIVLRSEPVVTVCKVILLGVAVLGWLFMLRLIQVNGILGVYAQNSFLKDAALSAKSLLHIYIVFAVLSYLALFLQSYLGMWYLAFSIPSWLFSVYFLFVLIQLLNQTIKVYSNG